MPPCNLSTLPSVRRQNLLIEFSSLKKECPHGVFISLAPGDPTVWFGIMFIRKGPYASAILRFQISFPISYPEFPPIITFSTEMFHPLITPLTTNTYSIDTQSSGITSATDEEHLTPGGFSLRHRFPKWFGITRKSMDLERKYEQKSPENNNFEGQRTPVSPIQMDLGPGRNTECSNDKAYLNRKEKPSIYEIISYMRSTFDDEDVLDLIPFDAAGNPGAWQAWRTHRAKLGKIPDVEKTEHTTELKKSIDEEESTKSINNSLPSPVVSRSLPEIDGTATSPTRPKEPGEWSWDGVWQVRAKKCIEASFSESVLFGKDFGDEFIRFLHLDREKLDDAKSDIKKSLEEIETLRKDSS